VRGAEPGIAETVVGAVRRALESLGIELGPASAPIGLVVPGVTADGLLDGAAASLGDDAIGLTLATRIPIGSLGAIDYGFATSGTLREALQLVARYYGVATQRVRLELVGDTRLVFHRLTGSEHSRHWLELPAAVIATRIRQTLGEPELAFARVAFRHGPPARRERHDAFFGTRVAFGAELDVLEFAPVLLDRPLHTASKSLAELLEQRLRELEPQMAAIDPVLDRVRRTLIAMLDDGLTDLETLATRLELSKRTLQRTLRERGQSHTELVDELRSRRAAELLDRGLRVVEVAQRLGFSEPSAFFRAYRRWTGTSPKGARSSR
jgi:AraC-like DNA-binding protein